jgi:hypothetical protein
MSSSSLMIGSLLIVVVIAVIAVYTKTSDTVADTKTENFDAVGYVYNVPPNWFMKQNYDPREWLVRTYPDHIESSCMPYSRASKFGSLANINYLSNASRFWRM